MEGDGFEEFKIEQETASENDLVVGKVGRRDRLYSSSNLIKKQGQ